MIPDFLIQSLRGFCLVAFASVLVASHMGCQDASRGIAVNISFSDSEVEVNGTKFNGAVTIDQLEKVLGVHDRKVVLVNDIYVWDSCGIYAYTGTDNAVVTDFNVAYENEGYDFSPKKNFAGKVTISGNAFNQGTAQKHFLKNGFQESSPPDHSCILEMGRRSIIIDHNESLSSIQGIAFGLM